MATPAITPSTRYYDVGKTKVYFLPSVSNPASPTRTEMNAGTDLSPEIEALAGWSVTGVQIQTPDFSNRFTAQIAGRIDAAASSLTFYASSNSNDVRSLLPRDTAGYILWLDGGDVTGHKMDVYPVTVTSVSKMRDTTTNAARIMITFSITAAPSENVAIP